MRQLWCEFRQLVWNWVWGPNLSSLPRGQAWVLQVCRTVHMVVRELIDGNLNLRVGGLIYTTLLSLVPALAVSFAMLKAFNVHESLEPTLAQALQPLGDKGPEIAAKMVAFVAELNLAKLGSVGFAALLLTVVSLVYKVEQALNDAWRVPSPRHLVGRISGYITVVMVGPVLVFTAVGMTAAVVGSDVVREYSQAGFLNAVLTSVTQGVPYLLLFAAFTFVYLYIPNTRVRLRSALVGGIVGGLLWAGAGWVFASMVVGSARYTVLYSSFAILILFMMWLHIAWIIVLVGGSVAFYHQNPDYLGLLTHELQMSNRVRERLGILACYRIAQSFMHGDPPPTLVQLSREFDVPLSPLESLLGALEAAGLLTRTESTPVTFMPARSPDSIRLDDLLAAIRRAHETGHLNLDRLNSDERVASLFQALDSHRHAALEDRTLRDLVDEATPASGDNSPSPSPSPGQSRDNAR